MSIQSKSGTVFIATGVTVGAGISTTVGGMGLAGGFGAIGIGAAPVIGIGAIFGAATYGAIHGLGNGDPLAMGAVSLGAVGGIGVAGSIGKLGLIAPKIGLAVGFGTVPIVLMGGVFGLAAYGLGKMLDSSISETPSMGFDRQSAHIDWQADYNKALLDLTLVDLKWVDLELELRASAVEDEFQALKKKLLDLSTDNFDAPPAKTTHKTASEPNSSKANSVDVESQNDDSSESIQVYPRSTWQLLSTLKGHTAPINCLAFSPDGQQLVSGSDDRTVNLWNVFTLKRLYSFFGANDGILDVSFCHRGKTVTASSADRSITSWRVENKQLLYSFLYLNPSTSHTNLVHSIDYNPNGQILASGSADKSIRLWNTSSGKLKKTLAGHTDTVFDVIFSPDGLTLASASADQTIRLWEVDQSQVRHILTGHHGWINVITISPDGNILISGSIDQTIKTWNLKTGELIATYHLHQAGVISLSISIDNKTIASLDSNGCLLIWNLSNGVIEAALTGKNCAKFSPNGLVLAVAEIDNTIKLWQRANADSQIGVQLPLTGEWWEILGVSPYASTIQVKSVYLQLARQYHPDLNSSTMAELQMQIINVAYQEFQHNHTTTRLEGR